MHIYANGPRTRHRERDVFSNSTNDSALRCGPIDASICGKRGGILIRKEIDISATVSRRATPRTAHRPETMHVDLNAGNRFRSHMQFRRTRIKEQRRLAPVERVTSSGNGQFGRRIVPSLQSLLLRFNSLYACLYLRIVEWHSFCIASLRRNCSNYRRSFLVALIDAATQTEHHITTELCLRSILATL